MARWDEKGVNSFSDQKVVLTTAYEQRYLRSALLLALPRLSSRTAAAEFGAGYGRMTVVLEEFFSAPTGFEREAGLITLSREVRMDSKILKIDGLAAVPAETGSLAASFTCTVLQHMTDDETAATTAEMKRVTLDFIFLIENTTSGYVHGIYGEGKYFTKGRTVGDYARMMSPWILDFERPRHVGNTAGPVWGSVMAFRHPGVERDERIPVHGPWRDSELRSI